MPALCKQFFVQVFRRIKKYSFAAAAILIINLIKNVLTGAAGNCIIVLFFLTINLTCRLWQYNG